MMFTWNNTKASSNVRKHGVDFADAVTVLEDDFALTIEDCDHNEERFVTLGRDACDRLLVVVYVYEHPETTRIISARKANKIETSLYHKR